MQHPKDLQHPLPSGAVSLGGIYEDTLHRVTEGTLKVIDMHALADYFRNTADMFATGEFWGKLMRAACLVCRYTGDAALRATVEEAARDMLSIAREDGCISTCPDGLQPRGSHGSDLWERKYVLMGLLAYHELTNDPETLRAARRLVQYTAAQVGPPPKVPITKTGWAFEGIESASILEPVMRVYHLTGDAEALAFGRYIVRSGCCARENIFDAIRRGKSPKDIGDNGFPTQSIAKAYEMMSCFEGLCEYYRATGETWALETAQIFWDKVADEEITLLGSGGADAPFNLGPGTGEQWNRTRYEQTNPDIKLAMETCVTVYWMRLSHQLLRLTGQVKYADAIERSLYNAIYGAVRPDGRFFEYFPRLNGARNAKVNYSFNIGGFDLSCCTANGPTALGMVPCLAFCATAEGVAVNLYENATFRVPTDTGAVTLRLTTDYPRSGRSRLEIVSVEGALPRWFIVSLRVPAFARNFRVTQGDRTEDNVYGVPETYLRLGGHLTGNEVWHIRFDIPLIKHPAPHGSNRSGDRFTAFTYGPLLLARDERDGVPPLSPIADGAVLNYQVFPSSRGGFADVDITLENEQLHLIDYMTAGNDWDGGTFAAWLPLQ